METINALGKKCPLPVIEAKKALDAIGEGQICVLVDNKEAVGNLGKLAKSRNMESNSTENADGTFAVAITKKAATTDESCDCAALTAGPTIVVIGSDKMGVGDDALGTVLIKGFVYALTQLDTLPSQVILYNSGVKLACTGAETLADLQNLAQNGVEVLACGTCLNHFELADELGVGEVTNMYAIVEAQAQAGRIIRP